jgi:hypothetical protein
MIFLLHFALSIADSLELRKLNARGWTLLFCTFISEPFLTWKTRMATFRMLRRGEVLCKPCSAAPPGEDDSFEIQY